MKKLFCAIALVMLCLVGCESQQQAIYDWKADTIGTHRIVDVYTESGEHVRTIEDESMRFEMVGERTIRLWLGDKNEKVMIVNMDVIVTDK